MLSRRFFYIIFALLVCICLVAFSSGIIRADDDATGPRMQFEEVKYDFGTVGQGVQLSHPFKFKNVGTDTLKIAQVKTSCGCTAAWESSKIIPPKAEGQIEVRFDTGGRSGAFSKKIYVYSNDSKSATHSLLIHGKIERKPAEQKSDSGAKAK